MIHIVEINSDVHLREYDFASEFPLSKIRSPEWPASVSEQHVGDGEQRCQESHQGLLLKPTLLNTQTSLCPTSASTHRVAQGTALGPPLLSLFLSSPTSDRLASPAGWACGRNTDSDQQCSTLIQQLSSFCQVTAPMSSLVPNPPAPGPPRVCSSCKASLAHVGDGYSYRSQSEGCTRGFCSAQPTQPSTMVLHTAP